MHLLCDYTGAENPIREVTEDLKADVVEERVVGLVGVGTVVATENVVDVFLASYHSDLMSLLFLVFISFYSCLGPPLIVRALL